MVVIMSLCHCERSVLNSLRICRAAVYLVLLIIMSAGLPAWADTAAGEFQSDDFNSCELKPIWTFVDPLGDTTAPTIQGAFSGDSKVAIVVPGGSTHELYNGIITAPYIIQSTTDTDFTLEVKFDSVLPAISFAEQGIIVRQDDTTWIRLEFFGRTSDTVTMLAGLPDNSFPNNVVVPGVLSGESPLYMRIQRVGDEWTQSYRTASTGWTDLAAFTYAMNVTGVGLYAGNAGLNPGHTVLVDYFSNSLDPIVEPDDTGQNTLTTTAVGNGSVSRDIDLPFYACNDLVELTATPDPGYSFAGWSGDLTGFTNPVTVEMLYALDITATFALAGPPTANDDVASVVAGAAVVVDVLANDAPGDGSLLPNTVAVVDAPLNGTITNINPTTGAITYTNGGGVALADSFTYTVEDQGGISNAATVRVTIETPIPPTALDNNLLVAPGEAGDIDVLANDSPGNGSIDPSSVAVVDPPDNGSITNIDPFTGVVTYTHDGGVAVADSFTYTVDDVNGATSNEATVRISIGLIPPGEFVSDDFNSCELKPIWTYVDPQGDSAPASTQGAFTGNAQAVIPVAGVVEHQLRNGTIGAPYIIQSTNDTDFTLEVKFDTVLPVTNFAEQGIIVRESDTEWLRLEFYSRSTDTLWILAGLPDNSFAHNFAIPGALAGASPVYMRIDRTGDTWTQSYKIGAGSWVPIASFDYTMNVTGVGLYAGNAGVFPAFSVLADYFSNTKAPILEPDDDGLNAIDVQVTGSGTVALNPDQSSYACGETVFATATPAGGWQFAGWSGDFAGTDNPLEITMNGPVVLGALFTSASANTVAANTGGVPDLTAANPCSQVPVQITRGDGVLMRSFAVTVDLTNLAPCAGTASITEGTYLSAIGATTFQVTDNLDGSYLVEGSITGEPCGAMAPTGDLFYVDVVSSVPNGTGTIAVSGITLTDCAAGVMVSQAGAAAAIDIIDTVPMNVTNFGTGTIGTGNPAGNVAGIQLTWTPTTDPKAADVLLYRKAHGAYPEFSDGGGSAPAVPTDPVAEGWTLLATLPIGDTGYADLPTTRDYYYYCTVVTDASANAGTALVSPGALNYILGDASDGGEPVVDGDNAVDIADLTLLGSAYGSQDGQGTYLNTLDIGPTDDMSPEGLPATDNVIDFEDLILFGLSYGKDVAAKSLAAFRYEVPEPAAENELSLYLPAMPNVGGLFNAGLDMRGDGTIQGLQVRLSWDATVVTPVGAAGGSLLQDQQGNALVLTAEPGTVDICLIGRRESGISGQGEIAAIRFRVLAAGDPRIVIEEITARTAGNGPAVVNQGGGVDEPEPAFVPQLSALHPNYPNPFNPSTTISYDMASRGRARINIFSIDGRLVRSLVDAIMEPGRYTTSWDGSDNAGRRVSSGIYLYRMETADLLETRRMMLIK